MLLSKQYGDTDRIRVWRVTRDRKKGDTGRIPNPEKIWRQRIDGISKLAA